MRVMLTSPVHANVDNIIQHHNYLRLQPRRTPLSLADALGYKNTRAAFHISRNVDDTTRRRTTCATARAATTTLSKKPDC